MNQIEQWFSVLQRKRLRILDFSDLNDLAKRLLAFVFEWNAHAHSFNWSAKLALKVTATIVALARGQDFDSGIGATGGFSRLSFWVCKS